ncbi:glycosyltransferase family 2 protein [Mucilaginibacter sp. SP1R1]|uniref:glycosyltransferase family 2 protein n=1 Tax=Mucilaginibacter sp. SP1R1 TaxID=2723091 RepID=UPI0017B20F83|nr:glycosyltransferase family 2 protein [Mucilaginibacter sp. SP1R1]MBB6151010.1 glycosyltransferase involved in cell wall biosynthesis [Mucilaginibacter sp. SP1R1]
MKLSLVTVVYNARDTIGQCIESVISQNYSNLEYIVIDGGSTDGTLQVINQYRSHINIFVSEKDSGIYDAMNKGIALATGEVVGTLNADDYFADGQVLQSVVQAFEQYPVNVVYGDLDIISQQYKIIRKWRSRPCKGSSFNWGFMPPHPTFYCKRSLFTQYGLYSLDYGSAADYELMVRLMHLHQVKSYYLKKVMVKMRVGGVSSKSLNNRVKAWQFDLKAMQKNKVRFPFLALVLKPLQKIFQFI